MATRFELVLHGENPIALRAAGEEALAEIQRLEAQLSLYRPTSEIAHLNARAAEGPVRVEPSLFRLLEQARRLSRETSGAFDITIAPLVRCWGFMGGSGKVPEPAALLEARQSVGMHLLELDERNCTVRFARRIQSYAARPLEVAVETATTHLMDWLITEYGFTPTDAYCLVSTCPDFRINVYQMCKIGKLGYVAGAEIPKRYLPG